VDPARLSSLRLALQPTGYEHTDRFALPPLPGADAAGPMPPDGDPASTETSIQV